VERGDLIKLVASLAILAVGGGLVAWHFFGGDRLDKAEYRYLVDITTGETYRVKMSTINMLIIPARHPETREPVLFPVERDDDGRWRVGDRYLGDLDRSEYGTELHPVAGGRPIGPLDEEDDFVRYVPPEFD